MIDRFHQGINQAGNIVNLFDTFTTPDIAAISHSWTDTICVVACRAGYYESGDESWDRVNHFVHATPMRGVTVASAGPSAVDFQVAFALAMEDCSSEEADLISKYMERGYALQLTVCDGNCPCDTIAIHQNRARSALTWNQTRQLCSDTMNNLSSEQWFQDMFKAAGEWAPPKPPDGVVSIDDEPIGGGEPEASNLVETSLIEAFVEQHPSEPPPLPPPSSPPPPKSPILSPAVSDSEEDELAIGADPDKPLEASDAVVLTWAMRRTTQGSQLLANYGQPADEDVKNIIALEELVQIRREYPGPPTIVNTNTFSSTNVNTTCILHVRVHA